MKPECVDARLPRAMDWRLKAGIQKVLELVPGGGRIHQLMQVKAGALSKFGDECDGRVDDWALMMGHLRKTNVPVSGAIMAEIGTGWYPALPFCFYLAGAGRIHTYDLYRHVTPRMVNALAARLPIYASRIAEASGEREEAVRARQAGLQAALGRGASILEATAGVVRYEAPADATRTGLDDGSVDVLFSNAVLQHIPGPIVEDCLREAFRILKPGGVTVHAVNCGDQYAYADRRVHQLNYLRYSETAWRKWNNRFTYQNRLRAIDFTDMAKRAGFALELDTSTVHPERLRQLDEMTIDPMFTARYTREQLALTTIDFVGRKTTQARA